MTAINININNRDRVLKAYCHARLNGAVSEQGVAPAVAAAKAALVGRVAPSRFGDWCREAEQMCQEDFEARQRERARDNLLTKELLRLHRENPWHGTQWADGITSLIRTYGEPRVNKAWTECLEYLREQGR